MEREKSLFKMYGKFYPRGAILFKENDPGEEIYIIQSGSIRVTKRKDKREVISNLGPGDVLGEDTFLDRWPRRALAEVLEDSRLLVLDSSTIEGLVRHGPELSFSLLRKLNDRLAEGWNELREWQVRYTTRKMVPFLQRPPGEGRGWTVEQLSEKTGQEEVFVRQVLERLLQLRALVRERDEYRVADASRLKLMEEKFEDAAPYENHRTGEG